MSQKYPLSVKRFISALTEHARTHRVELRFTRKPLIRNPHGNMVNGSFIGRPRALLLAMGKPLLEWLPVLVHESCHMDQVCEGSPLFENLIVEPWGKNAETMLFEALRAPRRFSEGDAEDFVGRMIAVEHDCEQRTVEKIRTWNLPIDPSVYTRQANAYLWYHAMLLETGAWYPAGKEPYRIPEVWSHCPDHFDCNYASVPNNVRAAYRRYCV